MWSINPQKPVIMRCFDHICWDPLPWYRLCYSFQISGTLLLNAKPLTSRANLKMKKSIMNSTSFHQSEWWSLCLETSKIIPLPNFLLTNKQIQQNDAPLLKWANKNQHIPKKKKIILPYNQSWTLPQWIFWIQNKPNETGWMHQAFLTWFNNNKKSQVEQIAGISIQMIHPNLFCGWKSVNIMTHPSPKLIRAPKSCWAYLSEFVYKHILRKKHQLHQRFTNTATSDSDSGCWNAEKVKRPQFSNSRRKIWMFQFRTTPQSPTILSKAWLPF